MEAPNKPTTFQLRVFHHQLMCKAKLKVISRWFNVRCGSRTHSRRWRTVNQSATNPIIHRNPRARLTVQPSALRRVAEVLKTLSYPLADTTSKPACANGASILRWTNAGPNLALFWSGDDGYSCKSSLSRGAG